MVPKASQRANGRQLATHLLNAHDNERVEVAHIRGAVAQDLPGALEEWHAVSRATRCKKYLYSLSINPDPAQAPLTRSQYHDYIGRVEKKIGLAGQPRAIVFHVKDGREHCHVVWSRIIPGALKAVQISHDRKTLQTLTRKFAREHGLTLPLHMRADGKAGDSAPPVKDTLHEKHQQERTGVSRQQRLKEITALWRQTTTGETFVKALAHAGYHLGRGDSVPYAVVDSYGEIHSLPRQIEGIRTKDLRERLSAYPPQALSAATEIKHKLTLRIHEQISPRFNQNADIPWISLKTAHEKRRAIFHRKLQNLKDKHAAERAHLITDQKHKLHLFREDRLRATATGLTGFLCRIPWIRTLIARHFKQQDITYLKHCQAARRALLIAQRAAFEDMKRQARSLYRVEKRESRSLTTTLRREFLKSRLAESFHAAGASAAPALSPHSIRMKFLTNAKDITVPAACAPARSTPQRRKPTSDISSLSSFSHAAEDSDPALSLRTSFTRAARSQDKPENKASVPRLHLNG